MSPDRRPALRAAALATALSLALACAGGAGSLACRLVGRCEPATSTAPDPPSLVLPEPAPVELPAIEGGRLLLRSVTFAPGSDEIDPEAAIVLDVAAGEILERRSIRVRIEGHSDSRGSAERNAALSLRRAERVLRYLVRKGVARERLEAVGLGASRPVDSNGSAAGRRRNRRVELVVL